MLKIVERLVRTLLYYIIRFLFTAFLYSLVYFADDKLASDISPLKINDSDAEPSVLIPNLQTTPKMF